jgi:hypothetical protein
VVPLEYLLLTTIHWMNVGSAFPIGGLRVPSPEQFPLAVLTLSKLPCGPDQSAYVTTYVRPFPSNANREFWEDSTGIWRNWLWHIKDPSDLLPHARFVNLQGNCVIEVRRSANQPAKRWIIHGKDPMLPFENGPIQWRIVDIAVRTGPRSDLIGVAFVRLDTPMFYNDVVETYKEVVKRIPGVPKLRVWIRGDSYFGGHAGYSGIDLFEEDFRTIPSDNVVKARSEFFCIEGQLPRCR